MILFLALMITAAASLSELEEESEFGKEIRKLSSAAANYVKGTDKAVRDYNCALNNENCDSWKAAVLLDELELAGSNTYCDEANPSGLCDDARDLLGDKGLSHKRIIEGLTARVASLMDEKHAKYVNAIWQAATSYICFKEGIECGEASDVNLMSIVQDWEDVLKAKSDD